METHCSLRARALRRFARILAVAASALVLLGQPPAEAQIAPPFAALFRQAEAAAPRLAENDANVRVTEGQALQAAARPNPTLGLESEDFAGSSPYAGLSHAQTTLSVSEALEIGGKRSARIGAAGANLEAARAKHEQVRADFAYDLALAYAAAELAAKRVVLDTEALDRAREDARAAQAQVNAGKEADLRVVQANAAAASAAADLEAVRADAADSLSRLAGLAGVPQSFTGVAQSLLDMAGKLSPRSVEPQTTPMLRAAEAEREAVSRRVAFERSRAIPDVTVSVGVRRLAGEDATTMVAGVSVPVPLFDNNRGSIAAAAAELQAADARLLAARLAAAADWRSANAQVLAADRRLAATSEAEAAAQEAYRLARIGYDAGRAPLAELLSARQRLTEARRSTLGAQFARVRAEAAFARLTGRIPFGENP